MAKSKIVGIDIGTNMLKLVYVDGDKVVSTINVALPDKLVQNNRVVSIETMSELIKDALKENNIKATKAGLVLNGDQVFVRTLTMPQMSADQLLYNIPYEFKDYIEGELKDYVYDFSMVSTLDEMKAMEENKTMEVMAAACPKKLIEDCRDMTRKAGLKLTNLAPVVTCYGNVIRHLNEDSTKEYGIIDIGYEAIRLHIFTGDCYNITRKLEIGMKDLDSIVANLFNVDIHLAHTYFVNNYENCQDSEDCQRVFNNISIEINRALNFYRFNNPESQLNDLYLCGGGACVESLKQSIKESIEVNVHDVTDLFANANEFDLQAIGIALD